MARNRSAGGTAPAGRVAELLTVAKYWRRWKDPRLVVLVLNNRDLNLVTWEQRVLEGDPRFAASQDIPDFPYARYAEMIGLRGVRVDDPDRVGDAWDDFSVRIALPCSRRSSIAKFRRSRLT